MGLDMYLNVKVYLPAYAHNGPENREKYETILYLLSLPISSNSPVLELETNIMYWRKANQIHGWFVENCANGVDDCKPVRVSRDKLIELLDTVVHVLKTKDTTRLQPMAGCFFGSKDIDEWYWVDLKETRDGLVNILDNENLREHSFSYNASW